MRIVGLTAEHYRKLGDPPTRTSGLYEALAAQGHEIAIVNVGLSARNNPIALARSFHPRRDAWRHRLLLGTDSVRARTAAAEHGIACAGRGSTSASAPDASASRAIVSGSTAAPRPCARMPMSVRTLVQV